MCGRTVAGGKDLARDDKRGSVGTKVLEEIGETIESHEHRAVCAYIVEIKAWGKGRSTFKYSNTVAYKHTHDPKQYGKDDESHELDWFAAPDIYEQKGCGEPGNKTSGNQDDISDAEVA